MTEAERAYELMVRCPGTPDQYAAARIMNAEQPHGSRKAYTAEQVQKLAMQQRKRLWEGR